MSDIAEHVQYVGELVGREYALRTHVLSAYEAQQIKVVIKG